MQFADVLARLQQLPATFRRQLTPYQWLEASLTAQLASYTATDDAITSQAQFTTAIGRWVDTWGQVLGIPRQSSESTVAYFNRILASMTAAKGPPVAMEFFLKTVLNAAVVIVDSPTAIGYSVEIPSTVNLILAVAAINYVRPTGVPFVIVLTEGGPYISGINFCGRGSVTGAYLTSGSRSPAGLISSSTNSVVNQLPTTWLTDPLLNPP